MKKLLLQLALLFLLHLPLLGWAQEVRISGRVVDAITKEPIPFASLSLLKSETGTLTDEFGNFQITGKEQFAEDSLTVKTLGYYPSTLVVKLKDSGNLTVELERGHVSRQKLTEINKFPYGYYGSQDAFFIQVPENKHLRKIRSVSVYQGQLGIPKQEFRFRIYMNSGKMYPPL